MAKGDKSKTARHQQRSTPIGPFVSATLIAEKLLMEQDGAGTIVRIVDRVGLDSAVANHPMGEMVGLNLTILVAFRAGGFKGKSRVLIVHETPSGKSEPIGYSEMQFDGTAAQTVNVQAPIVLRWEGAGQYWYDILLDDRFVSRIPLQMTIGRAPLDKQSKK
jgi:hypothetical protein